MHYRHAYHAGNFADVFKHVILLALLEGLSRKAKPWCFLDTHAGAGLYALNAAGDGNGEWCDGIGRLWTAHPADAVLQDYLTRVRAVAGPGDGPDCYPGSTWLAANLARAGDRLIACEMEAEIAAALRAAVPRAEVHQRDGYEMHTLLPPSERRGLVLIDPPFERHDEFDAARSFITKAVPRYAGGVFALWYPLKNPHAADHALRCQARDTGKPLLDLRLDVGSSGNGHMHACGVAVLKPPYGFETWARRALPELAACLGARTKTVIEVYPTR